MPDVASLTCSRRASGWVGPAERQFNSRIPGRDGSFPGSTFWSLRLVWVSRLSIGRAVRSSGPWLRNGHGKNGRKRQEHPLGQQAAQVPRTELPPRISWIPWTRSTCQPQGLELEGLPDQYRSSWIGPVGSRRLSEEDFPEKETRILAGWYSLLI